MKSMKAVQTINLFVFREITKIPMNICGFPQLLHTQKCYKATDAMEEKRRAALMARNLPKQKPIPGVKHILLIASGKGGVGKSTTAVNLATALASIKPSLNIGLLDADVYGPSIPLMMNLNESPYLNEDDLMIPLINYGVKCMSMGFLVTEKSAVMWRGLMVMSALDKLLRKVEWGDLDCLVVDTPPGTGDTHLSLVQNLPLSGVVLVTTPQQAALQVVRRGVTMFEKLAVPIAGIVQNMSSVACPNCASTISLFGDATTKMADDLGIKFLEDIILDPQIASCSDSGVPIVISNPESPQSAAYLRLAEKVAEFLRNRESDRLFTNDDERESVDGFYVNACLRSDFCQDKASKGQAKRKQQLYTQKCYKATDAMEEKRRAALMARNLPKQKPIPGVKHILLIASGKGGVGKSTTAVNLATALASIKPSLNIGLLDADVYGPSIPLMMNLNESPYLNEDDLMIPLINYGVKCMSMGFLVTEKSAVMWRGLMVMSALDKLLRKVEWGDLDCLVVDTPPGTGDTHLSLVQNLPLSGVVLVTTPQQAALQVVRRGVTMFEKLAVPIAGIVQNMSSVACPNCASTISLFGDATTKMADDLGWYFMYIYLYNMIISTKSNKTHSELVFSL
ncbi:uncharacterized protein LOC111045531 [Nilaparvata lugens]|uniref:uncharacterized protein LOC111045531 n=1 Tax=Nilaparvata lugens TaxID=108931 RepID=UPI00193D4016|nr:uncharacterized protein LOC111045531 [Nilaparvata lugens]